jgi:trehalose 6-phosphate phosphatase
MFESAGHLSLDAAIDEAVKDGPLLVAADFDGTLAPLVSDPARAAADPRAVAVLARLAGRPGVTVSVVSGRRREDLEDLLGPVPGVILIGEHGNDYEGGSIDVDPGVAEIQSHMESMAATLQGSQVEAKRLSAAFHYRNANQDDADRTLGRIRRWAAERPGLTVTEGKKILEIGVSARNKGDAVADLIVTTHAGCVIFLGDDTTDESVFAVLRPNDVGVKVGRGETSAPYRLFDVAEVADLLEMIDAGLE